MVASQMQLPSRPGCAVTVLANCHFRGTCPSFHNTTTSPAAMFFKGVLKMLSLSRLTRYRYSYSLDERVQKCRVRVPPFLIQTGQFFISYHVFKTVLNYFGDVCRNGVKLPFLVHYTTCVWWVGNHW